MLRDELDLAMEAASAAGEVCLRWSRRGVAVERKDDGSPVTEADREAERAARAVIAARFPDDAILGEEAGGTGGTGGRSGRRWILDPIDGTRSFIRGVPLYGVMVALEDDGEAVLGVIHFPALEETVSAARGMGCWWNGRRARVSDVSALDDALVLTSGDGLFTAVPAPATLGTGPAPTGPAPDAGFTARVAGFHRLAGAAGVARTWGDCYGYALVATGRAEAMLDPVLHIWDAAAVRPIVEEAGGVFTDWTGAATHRSPHAIATNRALADDVRRVAGALP